MFIVKKHSWYVLITLIVLCPLLPMLFGRFYAVGDMRDVFIPLESFFHEQQLLGSIPAWNPAVSFGFPVIASAQIGFFYPVLFMLRFLPIWLELPLALASHIALCAIGTFLFARRLGLSKEASFFTAISFSLSQFIWQHITHLNIFLAVAWFPWQMWSVDILFKKEKIERRGIVTLIALFAIPFLIGQIQIPFLMMFVALVYGMYVQYSIGALKKSLLPIMSIAVGSFLFASVQLLPTFELATLSTRTSSDGFDIVRANQHSYPPYHLPTFLFPKFYGNDSTYWGKRLEIEYGSYIGVIPFIFAVWFFISSLYAKKKDLTVTFFKWLAIISFLLALGSLSPFRLIGIEPSLWIFSAPARWLLFTTFSLCVFAGFGFDAIQKQKPRRALYIIIGLCVALCIVGNAILYFPPTLHLSPTATAKISSILESAKGSSISFQSPYTYLPLLLLISLPWALSHKNGKTILLILTALDLILVAGTTTPTISWKKILDQPYTVSQLPEEVKNHQARIYSLRDGGDTGAYFTDPSSRADTTKRELQKNLLVPMVSSQFGIYGMEWPASLDITEQANILERLHPTKPYAIEDTQLAKELTIGAVLSPTENGAVEITALESKPRFEVTNGTVEVIGEKPSGIVIKTNAKEGTTLIVRDTFYPGWHAYVENMEVKIQKSPLFFRSISIPAGEHMITMKYIPKTLYMGGVLSIFMIFTCIFVIRKNVSPVKN